MIKPVGPVLLVKVLHEKAKDEIKEEVSAGGIIIETKEQKTKKIVRDQFSCNEAEVIAMGDLAFEGFEGKAWCKVGDTVIFPKYAGLDREIDNQLFRLIYDEDVKAVKEK